MIVDFLYFFCFIKGVGVQAGRRRAVASRVAAQDNSRVYQDTRDKVHAVFRGLWVSGQNEYHIRVAHSQSFSMIPNII